jgi:prolyl-tRNA synthetase
VRCFAPIKARLSPNAGTATRQRLAGVRRRGATDRSIRVRVDDRPEYRPGFKFNEWELKGVPLRIEIGGRDLAAAAVTVARRDTGEKQQIPLPGAAVAIDEMLRDVQASLFQTARDEQERRTLRDPRRYDEMIEYLREPSAAIPSRSSATAAKRSARGRRSESTAGRISTASVATTVRFSQGLLPRRGTVQRDGIFRFWVSAPQLL